MDIPFFWDTQYNENVYLIYIALNTTYLVKNKDITSMRIIR